jgi:hypothetical protein
VTATASDDVGVAGVQFQLDGANFGAEDTTAPYEMAWPTTSVANGAHTLTAIARDAAGNHATATSVSVTVTNDVAAPSVSLTTPDAGSSVAGMVTLAAIAADDIGVVGVRFLLNGTDLGVEDVIAPYEFAWPTTETANGTYTLTAVARDAAGNQATASVDITVAN